MSIVSNDLDLTYIHCLRNESLNHRSIFHWNMDHNYHLHVYNARGQLRHKVPGALALMMKVLF